MEKRVRLPPDKAMLDLGGKQGGILRLIRLARRRESPRTSDKIGVSGIARVETQYGERLSVRHPAGRPMRHPRGHDADLAQQPVAQL